MHARRADARRQGGVIGDKQDHAASPAGAGKGETGCQPAGAAEMTPDDAEAAWQVFHNAERVGRTNGIGDEEGAG